MNSEDAPQIEPSTELPNSSHPVEGEQAPVFTGEVSRKRRSSKRNSGGGVLAVLGLIVPVVLGGVTVFGVYFLFLDDLLKPPKPNKPDSKTSVSHSEDSKREEAPVPPPQPTFAQPGPPTDSGIPLRNEPAKTQPQNTAALPAEREEDAANALRLAEKMWEIKPAAAKSWYRKVVENYPKTRAAQTANDWLKQQSGEP